MIQEPTEREIALSRITSAICSSLELPIILQTTVNEVGNVLGANYCAIRLDDELVAKGSPTMKCYCRDDDSTESVMERLKSDLHACYLRLSTKHDDIIQISDNRSFAAVPLIYQQRFPGVLMVGYDDCEHIWQRGEILFLHIVADQVAIAINLARLFMQMQNLALTDSLTGCVNRRLLNLQLERDLRLASRLRQPVSLIMIDIDHFKRVNDTYGHKTGDEVLQLTAQVINEDLRGVDTLGRYGGEEFVVILPQADVEGATIMAERIRASIERKQMPLVGHVTASLGVATYPLHADATDTLLLAADKALYEAKHSGRNRVCVANS